MLSSLTNVMMVLVSVAFFTLMERKILGISQYRKGPNKVSFLGLLQPIADAIKLFSKEINAPYQSTTLIFTLSPSFAIFLVLLMWTSMPFVGRSELIPYSVVFTLVIMSLTLYPLLLGGWSSMSAYGLVGATRGVAQTISYEISLALFLLGVIVSLLSIDWDSFSLFGSNVALYWHVILLTAVACVAETNRTPFDFAEGESELVSGFNIEYGAGTFAALFMAEYASIMYFSFLLALMVHLSGAALTKTVTGALIMVTWVWLRATLPRYRYDMLMGMAWKTLLPASLGFLIFLCSL